MPGCLCSYHYANFTKGLVSAQGKRTVRVSTKVNPSAPCNHVSLTDRIPQRKPHPLVHLLRTWLCVLSWFPGSSAHLSWIPFSYEWTLLKPVSVSLSLTLVFSNLDIVCKLSLKTKKTNTKLMSVLFLQAICLTFLFKKPSVLTPPGTLFWTLSLKWPLEWQQCFLPDMQPHWQKWLKMELKCI